MDGYKRAMVLLQDAGFEIAAEYLNEQLPKNKITCKHDKIVELAAIQFDTTIEKIKSKSRKKELVFARQWICRYLTDKTTLSLKSIGNYLGGRDHSTVIHANQGFQDMYDTNEQYRLDYERFKTQADVLMNGADFVSLESESELEFIG